MWGEQTLDERGSPASPPRTQRYLPAAGLDIEDLIWFYRGISDQAQETGIYSPQQRNKVLNCGEEDIIIFSFKIIYFGIKIPTKRKNLLIYLVLF